MSAEDVTPRTPDRAVSRSALTRSADPWSAAPTSDQVPARSAAPIRDPDRYEILGEHGRGGLGRVSRAHDKDLGRDIAIKELLSRGHVNELRFAREAMITARLEHPGIVPVHEAGRWPDGTPFYAMKLVSGRPLRSLIAERKTIDERIGLLHHVIAVADAIAYAHGRKIIHRDLKPANVIVGDFGETVVIDWGLAKDLSDATEIGSMGESATRSPDDQLTTAGSILGTPAYMAPEQERGEAVDQRADVFAIGAMLWELCSLQKVPPMNLAHRHRMLRRAGIDRDLIVIIDKAIDPDPRCRYPDAGALAADLKAFRAGARITARDYSLVATLAHWTRRHRASAFAGLAFLVLLVGSTTSLAVLYGSSSRNAAAARSNAATAYHRLIQSYVGQGRHALLDDKTAEALVYLARASLVEPPSPMIDFMLARAAQSRLHTERVFRLSAGSMWSATFSPDGRQIVGAGDLSAQVWDVQTSGLLFTLPHGSVVTAAFYHHDGTKIVTVGKDGFVKIWDAKAGTLIRALTRPAALLRRPAFSRVALSPAGTSVVAYDLQLDALDVWNPDTGVLIAEVLCGKTSLNPQFGFSADGRWFAMTGTDLVNVFDTLTWKRSLSIALPKVRNFAFDTAGERLVTVTAQGDASIWALPSGARIRHLVEAGESLGSVAVSRDGAWIAAAGHDGGEWIWDATTGELHARLHNHRGILSEVEFDPASKLLVSAGSDRSVVVSDVATGMPLTVLEGARGPIMSVHFDSTSRFVVAASRDGTARIWEASAPYRRWASPPISRDCGTDVTPHDDGRFLAMSCGARGTWIWDSARDRLLARLPGVTRAEGDLYSAFPVVSAEGDRAAVARGSSVEVYALPGGELVGTVVHGGSVTTVAFARTGHTLVSGSVDGVLIFSRDGQPPVILARSAVAIDAAAFLPDGHVVAADAARRLRVYAAASGAVVADLASPIRTRVFRSSADSSRLLALPNPDQLAAPVLWDLTRKRMIASLAGSNSVAYAAHFQRGDHEILTASNDGVARLWDGFTGELRRSFVGSTEHLMDATASPDGALVVTAGAQGNLRFWDAASGALLWTLRAHASYISGVHFEGDNLVTRGLNGELTRLSVSRSLSPVALRAVLRCLPLRFDDETGTVVEQAPCEREAGPVPR